MNYEKFGLNNFKQKWVDFNDMKKVLLISQNSLSMHANNGKTFTNIFSEWDDVNLAQIYFQDEIPESNKFKKFYRVRDIDLIKKIFFISSISLMDSKDYVESHHDGKNKFQLKIRNFLKKLEVFKYFVREILYGCFFLYMKDLDKWVDDFKPEALFVAVSDHSFVYKISLRIAKKYNIPIYFYYLDDFYFINKKSIFKIFLNFRYLYYTKKAVNFSEKCFCIGELMSDIYTKEFGRKFEILINPIPDDNMVVKKKLDKEIKILYAGGLTIGRFDALLDFWNIIKGINSNSNSIKIDLLVCTGDNLSSNDKSLLDLTSIVFLGKLNSKELSELYENVNFALHVESKVDEFVEKTRMSVSTKIPECLSKGICLIGYGPKDIASMKLLNDYNIGYFVNSELALYESEDLLLKILTNQQLYCEIVDNGLRYSNENFSTKNIAGKLKNIINGAS